MDNLGKFGPIYKKYLILFVILVVFVVLPLTVIFLQRIQAPLDKNKIASKPSIKVVSATAVLYASTPTTPNSVDIALDAKRNLISGLQLEMQYDTSALSNVSVTPAQRESVFFGKEKDYVVLVNKVNAKEGRISFWVGIAPTSLARTGIGKVATIYFRKLTNKPTTINFLEETQATELGASNNVLNSIEVITIK